MKWIDIIAAAFQNLKRRKLRSGLTMLGVVIGTAAIVVTISLGYGAEQTQMEALESFTNLKLITVYPSYGSSSTSGTNRITKITDSVISRIRRINGIDAVTPIVSFYIGAAEPYITNGKYEAYAQMTAVIPRDFAKIQGLKSGTYFSNNTDRMEFIMSEISMLEFAKVGDDSYDSYVDIWDILLNGQELPLLNINWLRTNWQLSLKWEEENDSADMDAEPKVMERLFKSKMVGIIKADLDDMKFSYGAIVNLNWVKRFQKDNKALMKELGAQQIDDYNDLYVLAKSVDEVTQICDDLSEMGLQPYSELRTVEQFRAQIQTMQGFLGFIGMISMLVAALSIANTMMMSIYERTREIGVMKVLGCKLGNIRLMFLSEAAFIGIFGGALGLAVSYMLSYALNNVDWLKQMISSIMSSTNYMNADGGKTSIIPMELAMWTWAGVIAVSVLSGVQPAQRAMKLSSLAAIRSSD